MIAPPENRPALPTAAAALVPHQPPMLLIKELIEREGDRALVTAVVPREGICFEPGSGFPEFYIEIIAQAVALANGYDAFCAGKKMNDGMLVGIDVFSFYRAGDPGAEVTIDAEKMFEFGAVKIIHGRISQGDILLAEGEIKVWEDLESEGRR